MKDFIKRQEAEKKIKIGYIFRCDDKNRPNEFSEDTYFELYEFDKMTETMRVFNDLKLNYDLVIEDFNCNTDTISYEINIKTDNWRNNN
jgi:hypothetical protein